MLCVVQQKNISVYAGTPEQSSCSTTTTNSNAVPFPGYEVLLSGTCNKPAQATSLQLSHIQNAF